jgi:hypothetical protein
MSTLPFDFPNDAPLPDGRPRCEADHAGRRCGRQRGHEHSKVRSPRHHIAADGSRWTVGRKSGLAQPVHKCDAVYDVYRCDRWPHIGYHGAQLRSETGDVTRSERIEWIGTGVGAAARVRPDDFPSEGGSLALPQSGARR